MDVAHLVFWDLCMAGAGGSTLRPGSDQMKLLRIDLTVAAMMVRVL